MNVAAIRTETVSPGSVCRSRPLCSVIGMVGQLLEAFLTVLAGLLIVGLLATQAQAHDGHDMVAGVSASQIEAAGAADEAAVEGDLASAAADAAKCDGHCCFAGACCLTIAGPPPTAPTHLRTLEAKSTREVGAIASAAPEGPRRPPRRDI